jgi:acid phosphatase
MDRVYRNILFCGVVAVSQFVGVADAQTAAQVEDGLKKIQHIVIIYAENRSFDNLYGLFRKANGIGQATPSQYTQKDRDGTDLKELPSVWPDKAHPELGPHDQTKGLPNRPFRIDETPVSLSLDIPTRDLVHRYYQHKQQINDGRNDLFVAVSDAGALAMGYYDGSKLPMWKYAEQYALADNFFMGAYGGSFLNHFYLVCACVPIFPGAPEGLKAQVTQERLDLASDSPARVSGGPPKWKRDGAVTSDDHVVNTMEPPYQPSGIRPAPGGDPAYANPAVDVNGDQITVPLPPQTMATIGDALSNRGISWAWYSGAWNMALADGMLPTGIPRSVIKSNAPGTINFQTHHHPFNYFKRFAPGSPDRALHLRDAGDLFSALDTGTLPQVSFYKPIGDFNQHPGYTDVLSGDRHLAELIARLQASSLWSSMAIIVTYDENGGYWDHVAPPRGDRWGPGTRVPAIVISPYAKRNYVDPTHYDTGSIIKFIARRFGLQPLPGVRPDVGDLTNAFAF